MHWTTFTLGVGCNAEVKTELNIGYQLDTAYCEIQEEKDKWRIRMEIFGLTLRNNL